MEYPSKKETLQESNLIFFKSPVSNGSVAQDPFTTSSCISREKLDWRMWLKEKLSHLSAFLKQTLFNVQNFV